MKKIAVNYGDRTIDWFDFDDFLNMEKSLKSLKFNKNKWNIEVNLG